MNRFVKTALAIAVAGSAANAGTGDNEWAALDSEIRGLASPLTPSQDGMGWAVLLRAVYSFSSDDLFTSGGADPDLSGFAFNDVDVAFWGNQGPYSYRVSADIDGNSGDDLELEDAYIRWGCGGYFDATMGNFKPRLSLSNSVDPERQLFIDRSVIGSAGDFWDNGVGLTGTFEQLHWYAGLVNGSDGHTRDHFYYGRVEFMVGTGAGQYEGAMGSTDALNGTLGLTYTHDDTLGDADGDGDHDNDAWVLDFGGNISNFGFGAEIADFSDDVAAATSGDYSNIFSDGANNLGAALPTALVISPDSKPWMIYGSYLINPEWEVAVRYEDLDNDEFGAVDGPENTVLSIAANWYRGSNAGRWQAQWSMFEADNGFDDGNIIEVGYAVGSTR
jgi:hypothetical protein